MKSIPVGKSLVLVMTVVACSAMSGNCDSFPMPNDDLCPGDPVPSVILNIRNSQGQTLPSAAISFRINNGQLFSGGCNGNCAGVVIAQDAGGTFEIQVDALGYERSIQSVAVVTDETGCNPQTRNVDVIMAFDMSLGLLEGAWTTTNFFGTTVLRFGPDGEIVGAIFADQVGTGNGNLYVAYNNRSIRGAPGQPIVNDTASEPTRNGSLFNWQTVTQGIVTGFQNAAMTTDFMVLSGVLQGQQIVYTRMAEIPTALQDPQ